MTKEEYLELNWRKARFVRETNKWYEYKIFNRTVWIYKNGRKPGCSCEHGSLYGVNKPFEYCKHIKIVKKAIKERRCFKWNWWIRDPTQ